MRAFVSIRQAALREAIVKFVDELSTSSGRQPRAVAGASKSAAIAMLRILSAYVRWFPVGFTGTRFAFDLQNGHVNQIQKKTIVGVLGHVTGITQFKLNQLQNL